MNEVDQLLSRVAIKGASVLDGVDQVRSDVLLDNFGQEAVHRATAAGDQVHDLGAPGVPLKRPLDSVDLPADAAHPVQELLPIVDRVSHA
jgi:hypothetical protein